MERDAKSISEQGLEREATVKNITYFINNVAAKIDSLARRYRVGLAYDPREMAKDAINKLRAQAQENGEREVEKVDKEFLRKMVLANEDVQEKLEKKFREDYYSLMKSFADYLDKKDDVSTWIDSRAIIEPFLDLELAAENRLVRFNSMIEDVIEGFDGAA